MDEAIGTLGLPPDVFWLMTWADFIRTLEAWVHNQNQHWDRTRYQSVMVLNANPFSKKNIKPKDLFKLPHDNAGKAKVELPTEEEMRKLYENPLVLPK